MSDEPTRSRPAAEPPLSGPEELEETVLDLAGVKRPDEQAAYARGDEVDRLGELTDTQIYEGELEAGVNEDLPTEPDAENLELLTERELRSGETDDANVAAEEGMAWVPPTDPPVVPSDDEEGLAIAAGFASTALDEPYDADHHSAALSFDDEMSERVHEALRADAATSSFADRIVVGTRGGTVVLRGAVDDLVDAENAAAVAERAEDVTEVIDEIEVRALDRDAG